MDIDIRAVAKLLIRQKMINKDGGIVWRKREYTERGRYGAMCSIGAIYIKK